MIVGQILVISKTVFFFFNRHLSTGNKSKEDSGSKFFDLYDI